MCMGDDSRYVCRDWEKHFNAAIASVLEAVSVRRETFYALEVRQQALHFLSRLCMALSMLNNDVEYYQLQEMLGLRMPADDPRWGIHGREPQDSKKEQD